MLTAEDQSATPLLPKTEHQVVVVFDITATSQEVATAGLVRALSCADVRASLYGVAHTQSGGNASVESWWLPEAQLKHLDGNDNGAFHLEPDDPPLDLFVEDDADDDPTVWVHLAERPDAPFALLRHYDLVGPVGLAHFHDQRVHLSRAADALWEHLTRGLPGSAPGGEQS